MEYTRDIAKRIIEELNNPRCERNEQETIKWVQ